jgi:MraZ protein
MDTAFSSDFLSTFTHPIDKKGRLSIPSSFRRVLKQDKQTSLLCCPAPNGQAIDAGGLALRHTINKMIDTQSANWEDRDFLETAMLGVCHNLKIDTDGRIMLPDALKATAAIDAQVVLVGKGNRFQLWSPDRFEQHFAQAQQRAAALWAQQTPPASNGAGS